MEVARTSAVVPTGVELLPGGPLRLDLGAGPEGLAEFVAGLVEKAGLATRLPDRNVEEAKLSELAAAAATQWTGTFNPRDVGEPELLGLYRRAF